VLRIKQTNGLNFATALPTSLRRFPILTRRYIEPFFMKFRGPQGRKTLPFYAGMPAGIAPPSTL
jgi:hypothetical protein